MSKNEIDAAKIDQLEETTFNLKVLKLKLAQKLEVHGTSN